MPDPDPKELSVSMADCAASHVKISRQLFDLNLDYSEQSLAAIDDAITRLHPDGNLLDSTLIPYGAYVGETVRRNLGGEWVETDDNTALGNVGRVGITVYPFTWVRKRFANGMEDSLAYKYAFVKSEVVKSGGKPAAFPQLALPSPEDEEKQQPEPAEDQKRQLLARSLLHVFFLVASADGKIGKKEETAFQELAKEALTMNNRLFQRAVADAFLIIETVSDDATAPTGVEMLNDLGQVGELLDASYAEDAVAFKTGLIQLATKIARASGGILGFGNRISKPEAATIAVIAAAINFTGPSEA